MDFTPNPIAFTIFGIDIRWYAICVCAGMLAAAVILAYRAPRRRGISSDDIFDVVLLAIPLGVIGARAWYVFFNRADYHTLFEVINTRAGGLAIQGGLIFGGIAIFAMCRHKRISTIDFFDTVAPCVALGQAIGRWGNYFNSEAHGCATDLPWAITVDGVKVHPTFLYESLWCLMLFIVLSVIDKNRKFRGQTTSLYLIFYSLERFFVEQLRTDSLLFGQSDKVTALQQAGYDPQLVEGVKHFGDFLIYPFKTAQFICLCCIVAGLIMHRFMGRRKGSRKGRRGRNHLMAVLMCVVMAASMSACGSGPSALNNDSADGGTVPVSTDYDETNVLEKFDAVNQLSRIYDIYGSINVEVDYADLEGNYNYHVTYFQTANSLVEIDADTEHFSIENGAAYYYYLGQDAGDVTGEVTGFLGDDTYKDYLATNQQLVWALFGDEKLVEMRDAEDGENIILKTSATYKDLLKTLSQEDLDYFEVVDGDTFDSTIVCDKESLMLKNAVLEHVKADGSITPVLKVVIVTGTIRPDTPEIASLKASGTAMRTIRVTDVSTGKTYSVNSPNWAVTNFYAPNPDQVYYYDNACSQVCEMDGFLGTGGLDLYVQNVL